jgi:hypothetical protein
MVNLCTGTQTIRSKTTVPKRRLVVVSAVGSKRNSVISLEVSRLVVWERYYVQPTLSLQGAQS